jgi:hypothetical protein
MNSGISIYFVMLLIFIVSVFLFERMRIWVNLISMTGGIIFFLNDWDPTVVSDPDLKLVFLLLFILYILLAWTNIFLDKKGS